MKGLVRVTVLSFVLTAFAGAADYTVSAQNKESSTLNIINAGSNEDSKAALALLAQTIKEDEFVILIARLGNKESARKLNRNRLNAVLSYLDVTRPSPFPSEKVVIAEGKPVHGRGRIEIYLRGQLFMIFSFDRNKNFAPEA